MWPTRSRPGRLASSFRHGPTGSAGGAFPGVDAGSDAGDHPDDEATDGEPERHRKRVGDQRKDLLMAQLRIAQARRRAVDRLGRVGQECAADDQPAQEALVLLEWWNVELKGVSIGLERLRRACLAAGQSGRIARVLACERVECRDRIMGFAWRAGLQRVRARFDNENAHSGFS